MSETLHLGGPSQEEVEQTLAAAKEAAAQAGKFSKESVGLETEKSVIAGGGLGDPERSAITTRERPGFDPQIKAFVNRSKDKLGESVSMHTYSDVAGEPLTVVEKIKVGKNGEVRRLERVSTSKEVGNMALKFAAESTIKANQESLENINQTKAA